VSLCVVNHVLADPLARHRGLGEDVRHGDRLANDLWRLMPDSVPSSGDLPFEVWSIYSPLVLRFGYSGAVPPVKRILPIPQHLADRG